MYDIDYFVQKFEQAVYDLAISEGSIKSRVADAHCRFRHFFLEDFPEELQGKRKEITDLLTRLESREGYIIPDNLRKMRKKTASKIAAIIVDIYLDLVRIREKERAARQA